MSTDNAQEDTQGIAADQLKTIIERLERLGEDRDAIAKDTAEVLSEAHSAGFDKKAIKEILKLRKMDQNDLQERDAFVDLYRSVLNV